MNKPIDHDHGQHQENTQQDEDHPGRFAPPADGQPPGDAGQDGADQEMQPPVFPIKVEDREQLVATGEGRDHDGQDVVLDQHHGHDQAEGGPEVAHGGSVGTAALVEDAQRVHVQGAKEDVGKGDDRQRR